MIIPAKPRVLVMIPTLNERGAVDSLLEALFSLPVPGLEVVVIDDQSVDGTAECVSALMPVHPGLSLIRRDPPAGRGLAGREGFLCALERKADFLIEMDGDFSHDPRHVPELIAAMRFCDVAIGSRLVPGGGDRERPFHRRFLTRAANAFARGLLRLPVLDANSGYRCFSRKALQRIDPATLRFRGPSIIHESLLRAHRAGLRLGEVPIEFPNRKSGRSKLGVRRLAAGFFRIIELAMLHFRITRNGFR